MIVSRRRRRRRCSMVNLDSRRATIVGFVETANGRINNLHDEVTKNEKATRDTHEQHNRPINLDRIIDTSLGLRVRCSPRCTTS